MSGVGRQGREHWTNTLLEQQQKDIWICTGFGYAKFIRGHQLGGCHRKVQRQHHQWRRGQEGSWPSWRNESWVQTGLERSKQYQRSDTNFLVAKWRRTIYWPLKWDIVQLLASPCQQCDGQQGCVEETFINAAMRLFGCVCWMTDDTVLRVFVFALEKAADCKPDHGGGKKTPNKPQKMWNKGPKMPHPKEEDKTVVPNPQSALGH